MQQEIFDIQKRPAAWGLVIPFLEHPDPNVQFFGAHTAQVKIARDWCVRLQCSFGTLDSPSAGKRFHTSTMRSCAIYWFNSHRVPSPRRAIKSFSESFMSRCVTTRAVFPTCRHFSFQITSLALILVPKHPSRWPGWIQACVSSFSASGGASEHILDFLAIVAEEVETAVIWGPSKYVLMLC